MGALRCLDCRQLTGSKVRRGLCRRCYKDPELRAGYPPLPTGSWRRSGKVWDERDSMMLIDLFERGMTDKKIADQLGYAVMRVKARRQRLGLYRYHRHNQ